MDTDSFIVHVKKDVETRFDTSNFELDRPLPKGENKEVTGIMEDELGGQIMKEFVGLGAKTYRHKRQQQ